MVGQKKAKLPYHTRLARWGERCPKGARDKHDVRVTPIYTDTGYLLKGECLICGLEGIFELKEDSC